jgi:hypothetical protein
MCRRKEVQVTNNEAAVKARRKAYGNSLYDRNGTYLSRNFLEGKEGIFKEDGTAEFLMRVEAPP